MAEVGIRINIENVIEPVFIFNVPVDRERGNRKSAAAGKHAPKQDHGSQDHQSRDQIPFNLVILANAEHHQETD